jgi:hypothetical protein
MLILAIFRSPFNLTNYNIIIPLTEFRHIIQAMLIASKIVVRSLGIVKRPLF